MQKLSNSKKKYRKFLVWLLLADILGSVLFAFYYKYRKIPDEMCAFPDREHEKGQYQLNADFLGFELKTVTVSVVEQKEVIPCGIPIGLYLKTNGIMVIGTGQVLRKDGGKSNPAYQIVQPGDYIKEVNGEKVDTKWKLSYLIEKNKDKKAELKVNRNGKEIKVCVKPVMGKDGSYKAGIWVRDDSQGIGTLTYLTKDGQYGALGHGISDVDTEKLLDTENGALYRANIWGITKGKKNCPGGLCGNIIYDKSNEIGTIKCNNEQGIYGEANEKLKQMCQFSAMKVGLKNEVVTGKAKIRSMVSGKIEDYDIKILKADITSKDLNRGMVIEVTDSKLLKQTNGIVQGMSGSPIIQNGKIIGAVTHVFVKDSTKGYGIFIENMLRNTEKK